MTSTFLTDEEIARLTGRARARHQVEQLRRQGIPFWLNAAGRPIVARAAIEGQNTRPNRPEKTWTPAPLRVA